MIADEALKILNKLKIKISTAIFGIVSKNDYKIEAEDLKIHTAKILTFHLIKVFFLKIALIHPIYKDKSKMICSNQCPIIILPILSKTSEQPTDTRLYEFIKKYAL